MSIAMIPTMVVADLDVTAYSNRPTPAQQEIVSANVSGNTNRRGAWRVYLKPLFFCSIIFLVALCSRKLSLLLTHESTFLLVILIFITGLSTFIIIWLVRNHRLNERMSANVAQQEPVLTIDSYVSRSGHLTSDAIQPVAISFDCPPDYYTALANSEQVKTVDFSDKINNITGSSECKNKCKQTEDNAASATAPNCSKPSMSLQQKMFTISLDEAPFRSESPPPDYENVYSNKLQKK